MNILKTLFVFFTISFLAINTEAMERDKDFAPAAPRQSSFHTLLGCLKISSEDYNKCSPGLIGFVSTLPISEKARKLLDDIKNQHGFVQICLVSKTQMPSDGAWISKEKKIHIRSDFVSNISRFSEVLIWECCNAANFSSACIDPSSLLNFCPNEDVYAFLTEAAEYATEVRSIEIRKDYLISANNENNREKIPELVPMIEALSKNKILSLIDNIDLRTETMMINWFYVNTPVVGSNYKSALNNSDLYRHADYYRSYYCWHITVVLPAMPLSIENLIYDLDRPFKPRSITDKEQNLIVWAFSQKSFELAKREAKLLNK